MKEVFESFRGFISSDSFGEDIGVVVGRDELFVVSGNGECLEFLRISRMFRIFGEESVGEK